MSDFEVVTLETGAPEMGNVRKDKPAHLPYRDLERQATMRCDAGFLGPLWIAGASVTGRSHLVGKTDGQTELGGTSGQDDYSFLLSDDGKVAVIAVADGLGSCRFSHVGAKAAVRTACEVLAAQRFRPIVTDGSLDISDPLFSDAMELVRAAVHRKGEAFEDPALVSTTFVALAIDLSIRPLGAVLIRMGDPNAFAMIDKKFIQRPIFFEKPGGGPTNQVTASLPRSDPSLTAEIRRATIPAGASLVLTSDGVGDDIIASPDLRRWFEERWNVRLDAIRMLSTLCYRRQGSSDDRTAVVIQTGHLASEQVETLGDAPETSIPFDDLALPATADSRPVDSQAGKAAQPLSRPTSTTKQVGTPSIGSGYPSTLPSLIVGKDYAVEPSTLSKATHRQSPFQSLSPIMALAALAVVLVGCLGVVLATCRGKNNIAQSPTDGPLQTRTSTRPNEPEPSVTAVVVTTSSTVQRTTIPPASATTTTTSTASTKTKDFKYISGNGQVRTVVVNSGQVPLLGLSGEASAIDPCQELDDPSYSSCGEVTSGATTVHAERAVWFISPMTVFLKRPERRIPGNVAFTPGTLDGASVIIALDLDRALVVDRSGARLVAFDPSTKAFRITEPLTTDCKLGSLGLHAYEPSGRTAYAVCWRNGDPWKLVSLSKDGVQPAGPEFDDGQKALARDLQAIHVAQDGQVREVWVASSDGKVDRLARLP